MPMSASVFAPRTVCSSPSASIRLSHSRRSVGVETLVGMVVAICRLLTALVLVKSTRERARPPAVVGDRKAVLGRQLDPDALLAAQLRCRMCTRPQLGSLHVDDAVKV